MVVYEKELGQMDFIEVYREGVGRGILQQFVCVKEPHLAPLCVFQDGWCKGGQAPQGCSEFRNAKCVHNTPTVYRNLKTYWCPARYHHDAEVRPAFQASKIDGKH